MIVKPASSPSQMQRLWNEEIRVKCAEHMGARNLAELRSCCEDEPQTLEAVNKINGLLTEILLDSAKSVGAIKGRRKPAFQRRNNWFDIECHNQRTIYRKKLREANKKSNHCLKKTAAKEYKMFLLRKKSILESKTNELLRQKKNINPKEYWSFFNTLVRKEKIPIEKSELFEYFKNLNDASKCSNIYVNINDNNEELNVPSTEDEIRLCINKIKCGKSAGLDDVYPEFIKCASDELILIITTFFNKMFDIGDVPDDWATSIYQPIFKKGEKTNPNNYRGISLTSCLCKLFTSVLIERIRKDLEKRNVLGIEQAGFRNKMGWADHVFVLSSLMSLYLAQKKSVCGSHRLRKSF